MILENKISDNPIKYKLKFNYKFTFSSK